jgi:hypothetical protein
MTHIGESAELYALGMLAQSESESVLAHAQMCSECAQSLERAQQVVSTLSQGVPQYEPRSALRDRILASTTRAQGDRRPLGWLGGGLVAGALAATLILMPGHFTTQVPSRGDELALSTIVQSHFNHVSFVALRQGAPQAKALYAKHLEWIYVIVYKPPQGLQVQIQNASGSRNLGALGRSGENGTLFVRAPGAIEHIVLLEGGVALARATPVVTP